MASVNATTSASRSSALRTPAGLCWAALVVATLAAWWLGTDHGLHDKTAACAVLLTVAFGKVYLIGMQFMELRHADARLRRAFQAYCVVVCVGLVGMLIVL
jgi:sugar phosphate permease